ncbi:MAG: HD domain-containing protein, partial [Nitrospirales bacterium]
MPRKLSSALLRLYDFPDSRRPGRLIRGYDRQHVVRTARMCAAVAKRLGHPPQRVVTYQVACLLHDLGRAGLDAPLFGKIWSWARRHGIPTRPREWRAVHPDTRYGRETEAFVSRYGSALEAAGIRMDAWAREQVEMRLGYARRLRRLLATVRGRLRTLGVRWTPWMTQVVLYYYYPELLKGKPGWVRELAEVLVACEQFEAYSNRRRGRDYYTRTRESLPEAFAYLEKL